jgi:NAD(P)-dependent dehydrogenase (short-subunit alcohol dehydrogenase family)
MQIGLTSRRVLVPGMIDRGWGRVINISSVYGLVTGNPFFYPLFDWDSRLTSRASTR